MSYETREQAKREEVIRNRKNERRKFKRKRRAKRTLYTMFGALIAFLISLFSGFLGLNPVGLYGDGSGSHSLIKQSSESTAELPAVKMAQETEDELPRIIVDGGDYIFDGITYDLEGIAKVVGNIDDTSLILEDRNAINSVFESMEEVLNRHGIEYEIVENYQ